MTFRHNSFVVSLDIPVNIKTFSVGKLRPPPPPTPPPTPHPSDKYSHEIKRSLTDPLTVHSIYPLIESSHTKEVVFVFIFQSEAQTNIKQISTCSKPLSLTVDE